MKRLIFFTFFFFFLIAIRSVSAEVSTERNTMQKPEILTVYYSYSGNTRTVAEAIHSYVGGDIFEIKAKGAYPSEYRAMVNQAKQEIQSGYRPELVSFVPDISKYEVIFIGSPNWWGTITPQLSSFLEKHDLAGKTVIPFVTHGGGGAQRTFTDLAAQCKGCKVVQNGWAGYGGETSGLTEWLDTTGYDK